jgi:hypothetical protein
LQSLRTVRRIAAQAPPLALLATLCLLALGAAGAGAKTRHSACGAAAGKAHARALHGCAKHEARSKKHASRSKHHTKRHHNRTTVKGTGTTPKTQAKTPAPATPAECEDGTAPASNGEGEFLCADGSEPVCADGAEPTASHGKLTCPPEPETGQTFGESECASEEGECAAQTRPICEDGSAPIWSKLGFYNCRSGEPTCETGSDPMFSSEGNILACEVAQDEDEEN